MNMSVQHKLLKTLVVAGTSTAIAFFGYKVYKLVKEQKALQAEQEELDQILLLEEARRLQAIKEEGMKELSVHYVEPEVPKPVFKHDAVDYSAPSVQKVADVIEEQYQRTAHDLEVDEDEYVYEDEEGFVEKLIHEPNSAMALNQYIAMRLADFNRLGQDRRKLEDLFKQPFIANHPQDVIVRERIVQERSEFFGETSKWTNQATIGELVLHFATLLDFDADGGVESRASDILFNLDLTDPNCINNLLGHRYSNLITGGFGIFGLNTEDYNKMIMEHPAETSFSIQYHINLLTILDEEKDDYDPELY